MIGLYGQREGQDVFRVDRGLKKVDAHLVEAAISSLKKWNEYAAQTPYRQRMRQR